MTSIVRYFWHTRVRDMFHSQNNELGDGNSSLCIVVDSTPGEYSMINSVHLLSLFFDNDTHSFVAVEKDDASVRSL
jgi:hypothetical protein